MITESLVEIPGATKELFVPKNGLWEHDIYPLLKPSLNLLGES